MLKLINKLDLFAVRVYSRLVRRCFASCGSVRIHPTARIDNASRIRLGDGVGIGKQAWVYAITSDLSGGHYEPELVIGDGTKVGAYCHLTCSTELRIGKNVLLGQGVYISDNIHGYEDVRTPIRLQRLASSPVSIGDETWLGNNCAVIRCSVGKHCVVGTNAVVTRDVPDYSVVVGAPARVIKRFDPGTDTWLRVRDES